MKENNYMSISEFAVITGIKRANLIFYDRIGLLSAERRGENNYRYYSRHQLGTAFLISELREIGIGIEEIKSYAASRTPKIMTELFYMQEKRIQEEIEKLKRIKGMMRLYTEMAAGVPLDNPEVIYIAEKQREPIFLGHPTSHRKENEADDIQEFYGYVEKHNKETGYPLGGVISEADLKQNNCSVISRFYLRLPFAGNAYKPAGRYVTGYMKSDYGKAGALYARLLEFIKNNRLTICGNAYEECPLNEVSIKNADDYITKVEIMVG